MNYMKLKITKYLEKIAGLLALVVLVVLPQACGSKQGSADDTLAIEHDTTAIEESVKEMREASLNARGIEPVTISKRISEIRPSEPALYDTIVREAGYGSNSYSFMFDGKSRFTVYEFESGVVDVIAIDDASVYVTADDDERIVLGDPFSKVLNLKGVNAVWQNADDGEGMWCWTWRGLWFQPDQQNLNDALSHSLYNPNSEPRKEDFTPEITIGYIGTGLPW